MSKEKYKFAVGVCGGGVLYTNIIKAADPKDAAKQYLDSLEKPYTEEELDQWTNKAIHIEKTVRDNDGFYDVLGHKIEAGEQVVFAHRVEKYDMKIDIGVITRFTEAKAFISTNGVEYNLVSNPDSVFTKIVKLADTINDDREGVVKDSLGQTIDIGDEFVYLGSFNAGSYGAYFFSGGKVVSISKNFVTGDKMEGRKKASKSVVVIRKHTD